VREPSWRGTLAPTVDDLSEPELVARIRRHLAAAPDWLLVGIGDDAAVVEAARNRAEVLTVDAIVEGVHFDRAFVPADAIGHRALAVNLSDLAAMGAAPRLALLSMVVPASLPLADFDEMVGGFAALAARHRLHLVGGNLTRSPGPLVLDVTVLGTVKRRQALTRRGARAGDDLYVTGTIGAAAAGLRMLQERATLLSVDCVERYLRPEPRVRMGLLASRTRSATACMDLSDGLADAAHQIAAASEVGVTIDAAALPIDPAARAFFEARGLDPVTAALTGGDDYELLIAARPRASRRLAAAAQHGGVPITRVGRCTADRAVMLQRADAAAQPLPPGYSHFAGGHDSSGDQTRSGAGRADRSHSDA
jgi:thiamine-monophosphate kinase